MAFFNFIETFFFLSLGITFVLILLLVYHFKQRLTTLENKCDTVFEIITNVVQEVSALKQMIISNSLNCCNPVNTIVPSFHNTELNGKIKVSEEEFEEDDEDDEDDEDEDDDDDDDDEDDDDEDTVPLENSPIRIINVDIGDTIESDIIETEIESENVDAEDNDKLEPMEIQDEHLHVEKLDETVESEKKNDTVVDKEDVKEVYSKMSLNALKTLVITKGLCSDASKLKKNELLKLLEA